MNNQSHNINRGVSNNGTPYLTTAIMKFTDIKNYIESGGKFFKNKDGIVRECRIKKLTISNNKDGYWKFNAKLLYAGIDCSYVMEGCIDSIFPSIGIYLKESCSGESVCRYSNFDEFKEFLDVHNIDVGKVDSYSYKPLCYRWDGTKPVGVLGLLLEINCLTHEIEPTFPKSKDKLYLTKKECIENNIVKVCYFDD